MASVAALAEEENRIHRIMQDREYNENGIFRFYFWIKDGWYGVNVNDELPMNTPTEPFSAQ